VQIVCKRSQSLYFRDFKSNRCSLRQIIIGTSCSWAVNVISRSAGSDCSGVVSTSNHRWNVPSKSDQLIFSHGVASCLTFDCLESMLGCWYLDTRELCSDWAVDRHRRNWPGSLEGPLHRNSGDRTQIFVGKHTLTSLLRWAQTCARKLNHQLPSYPYPILTRLTKPHEASGAWSTLRITRHNASIVRTHSASTKTRRLCRFWMAVEARFLP
jgi:hypothetical protein